MCRDTMGRVSAKGVPDVCRVTMSRFEQQIFWEGLARCIRAAVPPG